MRPHVRFKTRWSLCSVTTLSLGSASPPSAVHYFCFATRSLEASGAQRMTGTNGPILNLFRTSIHSDFLWLRKATLFGRKSFHWRSSYMSMTTLRHRRYPSLVTCPEKCVKHHRFNEAMGHHALARKSKSQLDPLMSVKLRHSGTTCL